MKTHSRISDKGRRRFLTSALLGGASIALIGKPANGTPGLYSRVVRTVLPTVVDSLRRYSELAGELPDEIIAEVYSKRILPITGRIGVLFATLSTRLQDLMADAQYRNDEDALRLRRHIEIGIDRSLGLSPGLEQFSQNYDVVSLVVNGLALSVHGRQQSTSLGFWQAWTETAHETIGQLSVAMESLHSLKSSMQKTDNATKKEVQLIQDHLKRAAQMLSDDSGDISIVGSVQTKAVAEVTKARERLVTVEALYKDLFATRMRLFRSSQKINSVRLLESVLDGCITWIKQGGVFDEKALNPLSVRTKHHVDPAFASSGLWSAVRQMLAEILPTNTTTRALACTVLVGPILVGYQDESTRFNLIYDVLPNLLPRGEHDTSDNKRKTAAERLSRVVI